MELDHSSEVPAALSSILDAIVYFQVAVLVPSCRGALSVFVPVCTSLWDIYALSGNNLRIYRPVGNLAGKQVN